MLTDVAGKGVEVRKTTTPPRRSQFWSHSPRFKIIRLKSGGAPLAREGLVLQSGGFELVRMTGEGAKVVAGLRSGDGA